VIEDELRTLLSDRAAAVPDTTTRVRDVHARISGIRRHRAAGIAVALVLLALAGVALLRLPGRPETLPPAAPAGPYFSDDGESAAVPGYGGSNYFAFTGAAGWSFATQFSGLRHVIVARCERPGDLTLRGLTDAGSEATLSCRVPVGDHYEGALPLAPDATPSRPDGGPVSTTVDLTPGSGGRWNVGVLEPLFPDRITPADVPDSLLDGFTSPAGGPITVTVPGNFRYTRRVTVVAQCVRGVQLAVTVAGRRAGLVDCAAGRPVVYGVVYGSVSDPSLVAFQRVRLDFRQVAGPSGQWAVVGVE
jgi:hypothetical protein